MAEATSLRSAKLSVSVRGRSLTSCMVIPEPVQPHDPRCWRRWSGYDRCFRLCLRSDSRLIGRRSLRC